MVKSNSYTPTNKYFRNKFQDFASTKTKKGHLDNSDDKEGTKTLTGTLVKVSKQKMYTDGWLVETTEKKQYWCSYGDGVIALPDSTESAEYYTPKKKVEVEINIDEDNKVYILTRLKDPNKKPIALYSDKLEISTNTNTDTNKNNTAKIEVSKNDISLVGKTIADAFETKQISVTDTINTTNAIADKTISDSIQTQTLQTKEIRLSTDEIEPSITPIGDNILAVNRTMISPELSTKHIQVNTIQLGDEGLHTRLQRLEKRIEDLEGE